MEKKFNEEVYRNGSEVVCDACGSVIKHINVKARIIARQAEGFNVTEQYFTCQECGKKYTVLIVDHEMQFLIQKRQQVERQIKLHRQIRSRAQTIQRLVTKIEKNDYAEGTIQGGNRIMMQMNIERMINATGSLLIWLVMILAAASLAGLIIIVAKAISQGIKDMDRKGERKDADNNTSER